MDINQYKAGKWVSQGSYKSFQPNKINHEWVVSDPELNNLLEDANLKLGALNAYSALVPDVDTYIRMHIIKEATTSSHIEGTQTNIEDAVLKKKDLSPERQDDWVEVNNYIRAMDFAIKELKNLPISGRLIKQAHGRLLQGARGMHKMPGQYRSSQNWIGGVAIGDAAFVPSVHVELPDLMGDFENFLNNKVLKVPHLVRIAIAHYQFETIHPFLDGNGRMGRLLITLYLVSQGLLKKPILYLSDFFDKNRQLYYDNLRVVSDKNDLKKWLKFFLVGVSETAAAGANTFQEISRLREKIESVKIPAMGRRQANARTLLLRLFKNPIVTAAGVQQALKVSKPTANTLLRDFKNASIIIEKTGYRRNRIFHFEDYLTLFRS